MKFTFLTLGCKLNFSESATLSKEFEKRGHCRVERVEDAQIVIVNTCSVTDNADRKCRQAISHIHRQNPDSEIVVTGCYAQLNPERLLSMEGVGKVIATADKFNVDVYLSPNASNQETNGALTFHPSVSHEERTRCFLKVQDGCDYFCSYCTIPYARGRSRSGSVRQIVEIASDVARQGVKEIVLTGVNIGTFGKGTEENLLTLCQSLDALYQQGIERIRISSIEPNLLTDDLIRFTLSSHVFAPHFHIPLQSGNNEMLEMMGRKYKREVFEAKVRLIKNICPQAFIGVDVIVGMRGETETLFQDSMDFIQSLPVTQLHVFPYSERSGTRALRITPVVSELEKKQRAERLQNISKIKTTEFYRQYIGSSARVLWEKAKKEGGYMHGFTDNYIRVSAPYDPLKVETIQQVTLGNINARDKMLSLSAV